MIRFGLVGFGLHGVRRLMPGFALAKKCQVTALARRDIAKACASAAEYNIPQAFASTEELCASPDVDAVLVTSPDAFHLRDTLTAISHGRPVLCEKPMAMNAAECRQMVEAARAANVLLGVAHVFRFEESTHWFREQLAAGTIGRPVYARSEFCYQVHGHGRRWLTDATLAAGGPIADVGVHCVDALRFVLQDEVIRVTARAATDEQSGAVEATGLLTLEFSRGTPGTVIVSTRASYRTPLEIVGDGGVLQANDALTVDRPVEMRLLRDGKAPEVITVNNHEAYARQVDAFAEAIRGVAQFPVPGEVGWQNQEILDAVYRSVKSGRAEEVAQVNVLDR